MHPDDDFDADEWLALLGPLDESCAPPEEPDWASHPVYAEMVSDVERIQQLICLDPADRPTGELARLASRDHAPASRLDLLTMLDQQEQYVRSSQMQLLAEMDRSDSTKLALSGELVSMVLRIPRTSAQTRLKTARTLVDHLPATFTELARGKITARHAEVITEASWTLEPDIVSEFEAAVLPGAEDRTLRSLQKLISKEILRLDPASAEARHQRALKGRSVGFQPADDGMALLPVRLAAPDAQAVFTTLTAAAAKLPPSDPRTMDQKRADLLVDAVLAGLPSGRLPKMQGRRPSIHVTVSADTLLNLGDNPGHLSGYGPITAETARRLAADQSGTWRRLLTDPDTGDLLDIGADHYRPSQRLRDFIAARDDTCSFPGCNQPAYRCEFEHTVSFGKGGKTCRQGGALACKRHNLCKIDTGWGYRRNDDGTFTWTTDTGRQFTSRPVARWPMPADRPPPIRPRPTLEQVYAEEDRAYQELVSRWQQELDAALSDAEPDADNEPHAGADSRTGSPVEEPDGTQSADADSVVPDLLDGSADTAELDGAAATPELDGTIATAALDQPAETAELDGAAALDQPAETAELDGAAATAALDQSAATTASRRAAALARIDNARRAIAAIESQRQRQLAHRADPEVPPF